MLIDKTRQRFDEDMYFLSFHVQRLEIIVFIPIMFVIN